MAKAPIKTSTSGYYKIAVTKNVDVLGFVYKPGADHTVDAGIRDAILAEDEDAIVSPIGE